MHAQEQSRLNEMLHFPQTPALKFRPLYLRERNKCTKMAIFRVSRNCGANFVIQFLAKAKRDHTHEKLI